MVPPNKGEEMMLYIIATKHVVSAAVLVEREEPRHTYKMQRPVYYISEVLTPSKTRYIHVQKVLYAILITSRKLRHYFQEHKISVITDFPLEDILHNRDATGRISKWTVELGALNLEFKPKTTIKSQALTDFIAEWIEIDQKEPKVIQDH